MSVREMDLLGMRKELLDDGELVRLRFDLDYGDGRSRGVGVVVPTRELINALEMLTKDLVEELEAKAQGNAPQTGGTDGLDHHGDREAP